MSDELFQELMERIKWLEAEVESQFKARQAYIDQNQNLLELVHKLEGYDIKPVDGPHPDTVYPLGARRD
jgi:hypothetical protein